MIKTFARVFKGVCNAVYINCLNIMGLCFVLLPFGQRVNGSLELNNQLTHDLNTASVLSFDDLWFALI